MANKAGYHSHGTKGGKFKRKNGFSLDFAAVQDYAEKLDELDGDGTKIAQVVSAAMESAAAQVEEDTIKALASSNLPAKGKYSKGTTKEQVIHSPKAVIKGSIIEIGMGFDKTKEGAGGWLITGTPKMQPDRALADIYSTPKASRGYENRLKKKVTEDFQAEVKKVLGGS
jgi:hypothetical protein